MLLKLFFSNFPKKIKTRFTWLVKNLYYGSLTQKRFFKDLDIRGEGNNPWNEFLEHFRYVAEYYPAENILKSPMILNTMFSRQAPFHEMNLTSVKDEVMRLARIVDDTFNLEAGDSIGWLSIFGAILEKSEELDPGFFDKMQDIKFIEFGPGIGIAGQLYSKLFNDKGIFFDLPHVTKVRSICLSKFQESNPNFFTQQEEFINSDDLEQRLASLIDYSFISTWAFTESPLDVREKFLPIIGKSKISLIVSNPSFGDVDNTVYLEKLSKLLPSHRHIRHDLSFLKNAPAYLKRHELHLFVRS